MQADVENGSWGERFLGSTRGRILSLLRSAAKTVNELSAALDMTDKFLDDAFLAQVNPVRIVHGMGTGALRQAISEQLRKHPHVSRFESAPQSEGGRGVTIVTLRD